MSHFLSRQLVCLAALAGLAVAPASATKRMADAALPALSEVPSHNFTLPIKAGDNRAGDNAAPVSFTATTLGFAATPAVLQRFSRLLVPGLQPCGGAAAVTVNAADLAKRIRAGQYGWREGIIVAGSRPFRVASVPMLLASGNQRMALFGVKDEALQFLGYLDEAGTAPASPTQARPWLASLGSDAGARAAGQAANRTGGAFALFPTPCFTAFFITTAPAGNEDEEAIAGLLQASTPAEILPEGEGALEEDLNGAIGPWGVGGGGGGGGGSDGTGGGGSGGTGGGGTGGGGTGGGGGNTPAGPVPPSAVPEPASWAMLIAGFGLIGALRRRRQRLAARAISAAAQRS